MTIKPFRLVWEFRGKVRGKRIATFAELEEFSQCLLDAGLVPWVPHDAPCPLDEPEPPTDSPMRPLKVRRSHTLEPAWNLFETAPNVNGVCCKK